MLEHGADRGEGGKFVSPNAPEDGKAASETAETAKDETKPVETPTVAAPAHLPQAIKAHWDKYGAEAQAAIAAHQTEMDRKFGEVGKQLGQMKPFHDEFVAARSALAAVTIVVLNHADALTPAGLRQCHDDLVRLLRADGLADPEVIVLSPFADPLAAVVERPAWRGLSAVKNGRIHRLPLFRIEFFVQFVEFC